MDLDAFFASVEQLDHPEWRGKPVIVGGSPERRGVVSTASYEARTYGVHSAMPSWQAARLCPQAIWTHGHYARYRELSDSARGLETWYLGRLLEGMDNNPDDVVESLKAVTREQILAAANRVTCDTIYFLNGTLKGEDDGDDE